MMTSKQVTQMTKAVEAGMTEQTARAQNLITNDEEHRMWLQLSKEIAAIRRAGGRVDFPGS